MTVRAVPEKSTGYYDVVWFAGKKLESGRFPYDSMHEYVAPATPNAPSDAGS
jgi:hypothetical protein